MATALVRAISITDAKLWKGGHRLVLGATSSPPTFPTKIESVINLTTMALETGFSDLTPTTEDGIEITREWDVNEGIATDQRDYNLRTGAISSTTMGATATALYSDYTTLKTLWELNDATAIAASMGVNVAQHRVEVGTPAALTERIVVVLQQNDVTGKMRAFCFRKGVFTEPGSVSLSAASTSSNEFTLEFRPDTSITDGSDFGLLFEED